jgi:GDP-L-fucose synthase
MIRADARIFVAGHRGMVGSAICRRLELEGFRNIVTRERAELDLVDQAAVYDFLRAERPDYIYVAAARVGGSVANNTYRAEFIHQNLMVQVNLIHGAHLAGTQHLMFLGSSCVYPRDCPQPIREEYLLTGPLEKTNEPYAIAKIAGIKQCEAYQAQYARDYVSVMPTNLYGPNDHYELQNSHVLPALIRKTHEAKERGDQELVVWGSGRPRREFLYVDDLAEACVHLMKLQSTGSPLPSLINIGCGEDLTIRELAQTVMNVVGFQGSIRFDASKPDGTPRKLLDTGRINALGWRPRTSLREGIELAYRDFVQRYQEPAHHG